MKFVQLFLGLYNSYIHLSILVAHFLSYFNDSMTYSVIHHDMSYSAHGPSTRQVSMRYLKKWAKYHHCLTTIAAITITTRGTVPRGTVYPIPNELSLWPRTMFRQVTPSHDHWRHLIYIYPIGGLSVLGKSVPKSHRFDLSRSLQAKGNVTKRKAKPGFL